MPSDLVTNAKRPTGGHQTRAITAITANAANAAIAAITANAAPTTGRTAPAPSKDERTGQNLATRTDGRNTTPNAYGAKGAQSGVGGSAFSAGGPGAFASQPAPRAMPKLQPVGAGGIRLTLRITIPVSSVSFTFSNSSGPGGQNVNKRATKCQLRIAITALPLTPAQAARLEGLASMYLTDRGDILISRDEHKSQPRNREACIEQLADLVARACVAPKPRRKTKPTRGSVERRLTEKKIRGDRKRGRGAED